MDILWKFIPFNMRKVVDLCTTEACCLLLSCRVSCVAPPDFGVLSIWGRVLFGELSICGFGYVCTYDNRQVFALYFVMGSRVSDFNI